MNGEAVRLHPNYGVELVDALTGGRLVGPHTVVDSTNHTTPYFAGDSRWVFEGLPTGVSATFNITAAHYVPQTLTTGTAGFPNPTIGPAFLAVVTMMPRTGYPFSPTLTRVVGQVRLDPGIDPASPPIPLAAVTLTAVHSAGGPPVSDPPVVVTTTDDGQYTFWFLPEVGSIEPPIANQLVVSATATVGGVLRAGSLPSLDLIPNGVTYAPSVLLA